MGEKSSRFLKRGKSNHLVCATPLARATLDQRYLVVEERL